MLGGSKSGSKRNWKEIKPVRGATYAMQFSTPAEHALDCGRNLAAIRRCGR